MAERVVLTIPEIHCQHCLMAIRRTLHRLGGVHAVQGDVGRHYIAVTYEPSQVTIEAMRAALERIAYPVQP